MLLEILWTLPEIVNKTLIDNKSCIIVIPVYKEKMTDYEKASLKQVVKCLGQAYEICIVCPEGFNTSEYIKISENFNWMFCNKDYFKSLTAYSRLCETTEFYQSFGNYEYMLIYQLDGWVFENNNLKYFLELDVDYIGSPWMAGNFEFKRDAVGNGGVSLRKISKFIELCQSINKYDLLAKYADLEDLFFCKYMKNIKRIDFNIADVKTASGFCVDGFPAHFIEINKGKLPMFAHGWSRGFIYQLFWDKYIHINQNNKMSKTINISNSNNLLDYFYNTNSILAVSDIFYQPGIAMNNNYIVANAIKKQDVIEFLNDVQNNKLDNQYVENINLYNKQYNDDILICIFNYKKDDNAKRWLELLRNKFKTVVLDSGNDHIENDFILFPNIYYSGLWNEMKKLSEEKNYKFIGIITSDIVIDDENANKLLFKLDESLQTSNLGCWSILGDLNGHSNNFTYANIKGLLPFRVFEGFFMFIKNDVLKKQDYIDLTLNKYGHGVDFLTCYISNSLGYVNKVYEDIYIFHPKDKGYNREDAEKYYYKYENALKKIYGQNYCRAIKSYKNILSKFEKEVKYCSIPDLSVIVAKTDQQLFNNLKNSINNCSGLNCEFIDIDNNVKKISIAQLYNEGIKLALSKNILFCHLDVIFSGLNWKNIINILNERNTGVIGFAGSQLRVATLSSWNTRDEFNLFNFYETNKNDYHYHSDNNIFSPVVDCDGFAFFVRKDVAQKYMFDENNIKGFHGYDIDFSLTLHVNGYINYVCLDNNICAMHLSKGNFNFNWANDIIDLTLNKWRYILPQSINGLKYDNDKTINAITKAQVNRISKFNESQQKIIYEKLLNIQLHNNCIYTCITNNYDILREPNVISKDFDYLCFTDDAEGMSKKYTNTIWKFIDLPIITNNIPNNKKQRYVKIMAHRCVSHYALSIWVDGSIEILGDLNKFIEIYCPLNSIIVIPAHPRRDSIYAEKNACIKMKKDVAENIEPLISKYINEGFPDHYGLCQSNIIIRNHNDIQCITFMEDWWKEVNNGSHRDLLSFNYVEWKHNMHCTYIDKNICNSKFFKWHSMHNKK